MLCVYMDRGVRFVLNVLLFLPQTAQWHHIENLDLFFQRISFLTKGCRTVICSKRVDITSCKTMIRKLVLDLIIEQCKVDML